MTEIKIKLAPAKPYEGKAQWQSITAARARFAEARLVAKDRYGHLPEIRINSRARISVRVPGHPRAYVGVVEVYANPARYGTDTPQRRVKDAQAVLAQFLEALRVAGWTVDEETTTDGRVTAYVYGPGFKEWVKQDADADAENKRRDDELELKQNAERAEMTKLLADREVFAHVSSYGTPTVTLYLDDLKRLLAVES